MIPPQPVKIEIPFGSRPVMAGAGMRSKLPLVRLPMMPQVLVCLLDLYHRDDVSLGEIADVIRRDAGMSAKIMSVATSASLHGRSRPASLDQCLSLLGMSALKKIVINESILQVFRRFTKDREFDLRRFWEHSLRSALIARELAKAMAYANHDEAYLGGLLHDVGQLAMLAADADSYFPLITHRGDDDGLCALEQQSYELTHAEVGAWLIEKWELDSLLSDGVLYHHDPVERLVGAHALIRIVFLANRLALLRGQPLSAADSELARQCDAGNVELAPLLEKIEQELIDLAQELGIELLETLPGDPASDDAANCGADVLSDRVRDVLLVDNVLGDVLPSDSLESTLHHIAQAAKVLFKVNPVFYFLPHEKGSDRYCAHPIGGRSAQVSQLDFVRGRSKSGVARAIDHGILSIAADSPDNELLDHQLLRLTGSAGLLLVPLRSKGECQGVLVAGFASVLQANDLWTRIPCFESFASLAGDLLRQGLLPVAAALSATPAGEDAGRERLRRVVHEIGNPLAIIQNYLSTLKAKYAQSDVGTRELGIVSDEIGRLTRILHDALHDSGETPSAVGAVKLNALIENLVLLCRNSGFVAKSVDIRTELFADPPELWTDSDRLKQLLLNLIKNAVEAMPSGGVVRVGSAPWGNGVRPTHIEIRIDDSGSGIPAEVLANLYQPVSSSKGSNHQGVGLAIVGQLVGDLHGLINCRSSEQGSSFQLLLPLGKR
ncbi:MAG: histidine kinase [Proteobacteria bacterium]|nr:histidine kinase [Pseudomonadota bacterium]